MLINLASEEYLKSVREKTPGVRVVTPIFEDWNDGQYKIVSFYAKRARGLMSRYAADRQIVDVAELREFDGEGYAFAADASDDDIWVFRRQ